MELSDVLKALGDQNRLRIFGLLAENELCVCILSEVLQTSQPNVSKHLNRLRYSGVIKCRKISQWCFYRISDAFKDRYGALLELILSELAGDERFQKDKELLQNVLDSEVCYQQLMRRDRDKQPL